jgi:hypothetical protein
MHILIPQLLAFYMYKDLFLWSAFPALLLI